MDLGRCLRIPNSSCALSCLVQRAVTFHKIVHVDVCIHSMGVENGGSRSKVDYLRAYVVVWWRAASLDYIIHI